jgi:hypothetical protein
VTIDGIPARIECWCRLVGLSNWRLWRANLAVRGRGWGRPLASPPTPPGTQACPSPSGTITAADVVGPTAQGVAPGEFDELVRAIRAGAAYANVHSTLFPRR